MNSIPSTETLVETKVCQHCGEKFPITNVDLEFLEKLAPMIAGSKIALPAPNLCPECCRIYRLAWRNERKIYKRKCDATQKDIISIFPPSVPIKVYQEDVWNSDFWDAKTYGRDYDFNRPFFEQFSELLREVPVASKSTRNCENSDYSHAATSAKNCYLSFSLIICEDLYYVLDATSSNRCIDCLTIFQCENCYQCSLAFWSYNVYHSYDIQDCRDSRFLLSCKGCKDCYGCFDLTDKQYCIYNREYSQQEYKNKLQILLALPFFDQNQQFEQFYKGKYLKHTIKNTGSENVIDCENVVDSQNISHCRHIRGGQNLRYCQKFAPTSNLMMLSNSYGNNSEKVYFSQQVWGNALNIYFCVSVFCDVSDMYYSVNCRNGVKNCFGCVGMRNASYCILNKQYSKEEYEKLVPRIIAHMQKTGEWGSFFPPKLSYFGYNEAVTDIVAPLTRDEALKQGFNWSDYEAPFPKVDKIISASKLPEDITKIPDDILNWAIECEVTKKPFRIIKQELEFYRKHNLPIPRRHPDQRYLDRFNTWYINY